jgi:hypothetical protein
MDTGGPAQVLHGRRVERDVLDRLLEAVWGGQSRVLVVSGEPGVGKTALLQSAIESAPGFRVARAVGVESEMELAFAALQQLCAPMLHRLDRLPAPQQEALGVAFGLRGGNAPDRFLVGLAVLSLLSEVAEEQPIVCVVDDAQWLDLASAQALMFVARRLLAESVALLLATREPSEALEGLPRLAVEGLRNGDARALLSSALRVPLDDRVRERLIAETRGNPLALLELPRGLTPAELAGGFGLPDAPGLSGRIEDSFQRRVARLPTETRRFLLVAAAEPVGDPVLLRGDDQQLQVRAREPHGEERRQGRRQQRRQCPAHRYRGRRPQLRHRDAGPGIITDHQRDQAGQLRLPLHHPSVHEGHDHRPMSSRPRGVSNPTLNAPPSSNQKTSRASARAGLTEIDNSPTADHNGSQSQTNSGHALAPTRCDIGRGERPLGPPCP